MESRATAAKTISQETFDQVVKENIEEFEMERSEAIDDAIKQFEAQNVDLSNIIKDGSLNEGQPNQIVASLVALNSDNNAEYIVALKAIQAQCEKDLAHRVQAGKQGAYIALTTTLQKDGMLIPSLQALCAFCNGQPDYLDDTLTNFLLQLLQNNGAPEVLVLAMRLCRLQCIMHEGNRERLTKAGFIEAAIDMLKKGAKNDALLKEICGFLRSLTLDDDLRAAFGKAHDRTKKICAETDALKLLVGLSKEHSSDAGLVAEMFSTLARLAVRNEFCQVIADLDGVKLLLEALAQHADKQVVVRQAMFVIKAICGNDDVKMKVVQAGGAVVIVESLNRHIRSAAVCEMGCSAIGALCLRNPAHCDVIAEAKGHEPLVKALELHSNEVAVQKCACRAIRNLVSRTRHLCKHVLDLGAESLLNHARLTHKECADEAHAALRDLGCKVELQERWRGEGQAMVN